jgi:para-nitrobenzyl esterase
VFGVPSGTPDQFAQRTRQRYGEFADRFFTLYPARSESESNASQLESFRDLVFWSLRRWALQQSTRGTSKAYLYYFTHEPPVPPGQASRGASHTVEIPYAFNNPRPLWTDVDRTLADIMSSYWVNFAARGDPNGPGLPAWRAVDERGAGQPMVLGAAPAMGPGPDASKLAFYDAAITRSAPSSR